MTDVTSTAVQTAATGSTTSTKSTTTNPNATLGKDAFMKLLLTEMQYQDPTQPMDTGQILQQTSELATLESADNTNNTLTSLATTLQNSQQFSAASLIGKVVDTGDNTIQGNGDGTSTTFPIYFPSGVSTGTANITDANGNAVASIGIRANSTGTYNLTWDGKDSAGNIMPKGSYSVNATYTDTNGATQSTKVGVYPVDSIQYNGTQTLVGVGPNYLPLSSIKTIY
jgi:flagellar basal-body rod modification protein FlgD